MSQGSVLGPFLFILYMADVEEIIKSFSLEPHAYADDGQIYSSCLSLDIELLETCITQCISEIKLWMPVKYLELNSGKMEFL